MSAPAANTFWPPERTTALTSSSSPTCWAACAISDWTWAFSAFIGGRSRRIVAIACSISTRTNSPIAEPPPMPIRLLTRRSDLKPEGLPSGDWAGPQCWPGGRPLRTPAGGRHGQVLLADGARQGDALPAVQESAHLRLAVPAVSAGGADRGQLAATGPASHGLGVDSEHGGNLGWGEEPVVGLDLSSHCADPLVAT